MSDIPKINASPLVVPFLATVNKVGDGATKFSSKFAVKDQLAKVQEHPAFKKALEKKDLYITGIGFALVFHGLHFSKLLLCYQIINIFCYESVVKNISGLYSDISVASEKVKADSKKDSENATKIMKSLNAEKVSRAASQVLSAALACILVIRGGLLRNSLVGYLLGKTLADKQSMILDFPGYEDFHAWTDLLVKGALYLICMSMSFLTPPLATALLCSAVGVKLILEHGSAMAKAFGKEEALEKIKASKKGLIAFAGLVSCGALWQLWKWASGSGLALPFKILYMPWIIAEAVLGLL